MYVFALGCVVFFKSLLSMIFRGVSMVLKILEVAFDMRTYFR
jgi:hypothetical protein